MKYKSRLSLEDLSCKLSSQSYFFEHISIAISQPLTFVVGKNGVGKSTLLNLISGNVKQYKDVCGTVILHGTEFNLSDELSCEALQQVTMNMRQDPDSMLAKNCTVSENLAFSRFPAFPSLSRFSVLPLPELVKTFGIPLEIPVYRLSGGQRQMLALLMAVQKPVQLLLLDEPTAALDERNADLVMKFIQQLITQYTITILCISHDALLVKRYGGEQYLNIEENAGKKKVEIHAF